MLRQSVFDMVAVAGGRYAYFPGRVFRLDNAFRLYVVGRLDDEDVEAALAAAATRWNTFLGSFSLLLSLLIVRNLLRITIITCTFDFKPFFALL